MNQIVTENESVLRNIPNSNLKLLYEVFLKTLNYIEYKRARWRKRQAKLSNNADLDIVANSVKQQNEDIEDDEDDDIDADENQEELLNNAS